MTLCLEHTTLSNITIDSENPLSTTQKKMEALSLNKIQTVTETFNPMQNIPDGQSDSSAPTTGVQMAPPPPMDTNPSSRGEPKVFSDGFRLEILSEILLESSPLHL